MVRIIQNYTLYQVIGQGAYGKVYRAINKLDNKQYAVKVIQVKKFQSNKKLQQCTVHQINILTNIQKNKHIITYYDMLKTQNNFYFVYQYCNGGTLQGLLRKQNNLQEKRALVILKQLLEAFKVLNKYNIMHRDLKPDNIFFHAGVLKLGDFGFCKSLEKAQMTKTMLGSPIYMAPQILNGQIYSNKADIWSIGVVLYQMLYGYCPFQSNSIPKLIQVLKQTQLQFPSDITVSNQIRNLLRKLLTKDPQKRIQWMELFQIVISGQGKIQQQGPKIMLVGQDKGMLKTVRQINQPTASQQINNSFGSAKSYPTPSTTSNSSSTSPGMSVGNSMGMYSPRAAENISNKYQQSEDNKPKITHMKKIQGVVQQGQTVLNNSGGPRKYTKPVQNTSISNINIKDKVIKFHNDIVRGINISRSMGLSNQRSTPIFAYFILKTVSDKMRQFRQQNLNIHTQSQTSQIKLFKQIFDQEIDDIDYQIAMIRNKVQQFSDWKKAVKAKINDVKSIRLLYDFVMFLAGENANQNITQNQMKNVIRIKIG